MSYDTGPTQTLYGSLQEAFDHCNVALFGGRLEGVVITLANTANSLGYFHAEQFQTRGEDAEDIRSQINLSPAKFAGRTDKEILSTLIHEMCHLLQFLEGDNGPRARGHNVEWARMMEERGLQPSSDGTPDGRRTGRRMTHIIIPGGPFDRAAQGLIGSGWRLCWEGRENEARAAAARSKDLSKLKHTCVCGQNIWGKMGTRAMCGLCGSEFVSPEQGEGVCLR